MSAMTEFVYGDREAPYIRHIPDASFYPYNLELTRDLADDVYGIGFASYGKLLSLKQLRVNVITINGFEPIISGDRYPIKRSLYLVTSMEALLKQSVRTFIAFYLNRTHETMPPLGFAPLVGREASNERNRVEEILRQQIL